MWTGVATPKTALGSDARRNMDHFELLDRLSGWRHLLCHSCLEAHVIDKDQLRSIISTVDDFCLTNKQSGFTFNAKRI